MRGEIFGGFSIRGTRSANFNPSKKPRYTIRATYNIAHAATFIYTTEVQCWIDKAVFRIYDESNFKFHYHNGTMKLETNLPLSI